MSSIIEELRRKRHDPAAIEVLIGK